MPHISKGFVFSLMMLGGVSAPFGVQAQTPSDQAASTPVSSNVSGIDHAAIFTAMKAFKGVYNEVAAPENAAVVTYTLMSKGSVLMENWKMASGKEELTVFHMDNGTLIATHYCAADVQSTMTLASKSEDGMLNFRLRSVTNLASEDASHNSGFGYRFGDNTKIHRNEIWTGAGKKSLSALVLVRADDR